MNGHLISDKNSLANAWSARLYSSLDGRGLCEAGGCPQSSHWVLKPPTGQSGRRYVGAIRARADVLYSKVRAARGRPGSDVRCDACLRPCDAQHMIQVCPRTRGPRVKRHDHVVELVCKRAVKAGYETMVEPGIRVPVLEFRKPDLIIYNSCRVYVIDATIVSETCSLNNAQMDKVAYYNQPDIVEWVKRVTGASVIHFSAVALNWRGISAKYSLDLLCNTLHISPGQISLLSLKVAEAAAGIHTFFGMSSYRVGYG